MKIFAILIFGTTAIKSINELVSDIQKHKAGRIKKLRNINIWKR